MNSFQSPENPITLDISSVDDLLDADSSPLNELRLHPDVAEAIWTQALQQPKKEKVRIELIVPTDEVARGAEVTKAIHYHFAKRTVDFKEELREIFKDGWRSLAIGLLVVAALLAISEGIPHFGSGRTVTALSESLIILAWVAIWHPGDLLLYAHFPVRNHLRLAKVLAQAKVILRSK